MLKICNNDFLFNFVHMKFFDICFFFVIIFLFSLCIIINNRKIFNKFKNNEVIKILLALISISLVSFIIFIFVWLLTSSPNNCSCRYYESYTNRFYKSLETEVNSLEENRIMIIGDSRMALMEEDDDLVKPTNFDFVAKSAMKYPWFHDEALPQAHKLLEKDDYDHYDIVVNMGVNDLNNDIDITKRADMYFKQYEKLAQYNDKVDLYILSVNPIFEKRLNETQPDNIRTNKKIEDFNKEIQTKLNDTSEKNMYYCDSYNKINFKSDDGIHYVRNVNKQIIKYIINDCIKY